MAYAALFSLAQTTNQILNDDRFPISDNGKHQITSLLEHLTFLQEFLEKFPNEASSLEVRIRRTANEAEDHLERLMYDQIQSHHMEKIYEDELRKEVVEKINSFSEKVGHFKCFKTRVKSSLLKQFTSLQKFLEEYLNKASSSEVTIRQTANEAEDLLERLMYNQFQSLIEVIYDYDGRYEFDELIKEVAEKINSISKEAADFESLNTTETVVLGGSPTVKSLPDVGGVTVGLDDDLMKIKDLLCGESSKLEVIPIVGMGGIGKTTLAVKAYHDQLIVESFRVRAWVTVSQDYKPQNIFADLLDFCEGVGDEGSGKSDDIAQDKVYKFLKGRMLG